MKSAKEMMETDIFVKEPVDAINKKIDEMDDKIIVLRGQKGSGKTTVMLNRERESKKDNISLYQSYDRSGNNYSSKEFNIEFFETLYELKMAFQLLNYIRDNKLDYDEDKIRQELYEKYKKIIHFMNNYEYTNNVEYVTIKRGQYVSELLNVIKNDTLTLMIDKFDSMEDCSRLPQEYISKYFDLFDKVILVSDDVNYQASYPTIEVDYGKNIEFVKEYLTRYLKFKNLEDSDNKLDMNFITYDNIKYLFDASNGNLTMMQQMIHSIRHYGNVINDEDFKNIIKMEVDRKIQSDEHIKKMYMNAPKPKFYI